MTGACSLAVERPFCQPVIGRLLVRQDTDPRLARIIDYEFQKTLERDVGHIDGTIARLTYRSLSPEYQAHLRQPSIITSTVLNYMSRAGAGRLEFNNILQGLDMTLPAAWRASLYIPDVLVTMKRYCSICNLADCAPTYTEWTHSSFPVPLHARGNALYYFNPVIPDGCENMGIDHIVSRLNVPGPINS